MPPDHAARLPALDTVRGVLACLVVGSHVAVWSGATPPPQLANFAVDGFFLLSGYVLALSYDGHFAALLVRRFIRLWPVYALCLVVGYALHGMRPLWPELIWFPTARMAHLDLTDKPIWTLYIEAWATPLLPLMVTLARTNRTLGMAAAGAFFTVYLTLSQTQTMLYFSLFVLGVAGAQWRLALPPVPRWSVWFGQQAYSLYLTNWLVLVVFARWFGPAGAIYAIPAIFAVAWAVWWAVERPSIALSRLAAREIKRRAARAAPAPRAIAGT